MRRYVLRFVALLYLTAILIAPLGIPAISNVPFGHGKRWGSGWCCCLPCGGTRAGRCSTRRDIEIAIDTRCDDQ